jgi:uncharacterized protein (DUF885 family)
LSRYNELVDQYYRAWFRYHPEAAVELGVEGYAHRLRPYADDDIGALISLHEKLLDGTDEIDEETLDDDQRIDLALMRAQAYLEHNRLIEDDWRSRQPQTFLPIDAIYQLTIRKVTEPAAAFSARLGAIPGYLRGARTQLRIEPESIPSIWLDSAIAEAHAGARYLRELQASTQMQRYRVEGLLEEAALAVEDFARFMEKELAQRAAGDIACGQRYFEALLSYQHGLDITVDQLQQLGDRLFDETEKQLKAVTRNLRGDEDVAALSAAIDERYRPEGDLLSQYRGAMQAAEQFVVEHGLVTVPQRQHLTVTETPGFLRHQIPFAAYLDPMPTDPEQHGYYYVTPPQDAESWAEHNTLALQHTCVHEAWPGHHLQFVTANQSDRSRTLPRLLNASATLYEGWALYCEQLMFEQGFLHQPESEFVLLKDRLWRALRIRLDVGLQTGTLSVEEAARQMKSLLGFSHAQAMGELSWYVQSPAVPMGYATGWALITATRERLLGMNGQFKLRDFHDQLLSAGSIALPKVLRRQFGEPLWRSVSEQVFGTAL